MIIKEKIKKILGEKNSFKINYSSYISHKLYRTNNKIVALKILSKIKIYNNRIKGEAYADLFSKINLGKIVEKEYFYYNLDLYKTIYNKNSMIGNLTIDYKQILNKSLNDFKNDIENNKKDDNFYENEIRTIKSIEGLIDRITNEFGSESVIVKNICSLKNNESQSFYESLQRILFINQILYQTKHYQMGLGRLDKILIKYYDNDIKKGILNRVEAKNMLKEFITKLHHYYEYKSSSLIGDTGQIIILGGKDENGNYMSNDLTYMFIELMEELKLPDPKVLLRVSSNMPRNLMELSLRCIQTGIGCPLFANDDVIINKLISFGYSREDAYNYTTSACWEPDICKDSIYQNNIGSISFMEPLNDLFKFEKLKNINTINEFVEKYKDYLKKYVNKEIDRINTIQFEEDPLLSLFMKSCISKNTDISKGGSKYNDYGITGVGLSNIINAIVNIEEFVFKNKDITLQELKDMLESNYDNNEDFNKKLRKQEKKFGTDNKKIVKLTNEIIKFASHTMENKRNQFGGKYKFGLSSPSYIVSSKDFPASPDGRKKGEPFGVHISSDIANAYTELIQFAAKLDYGDNRINGNVVDFYVSPNLIMSSFEKFIDFLLMSIKVGFFEMQMNVVSSEVLKKAKENPELFPDLIVRVWGFSAYFKDLPEEYKNYIIERAMKSEGDY